MFIHPFNEPLYRLHMYTHTYIHTHDWNDKLTVKLPSTVNCLYCLELTGIDLQETVWNNSAYVPSLTVQAANTLSNCGAID